MNLYRARIGRSVLLLPVLFSFALLAPATFAQDDKPAAAEKKSDETNLDTQLYIIVGTNQEVGQEKMPAALDGVLKDLRSSLPFKNYRLTATLINRVKTNGRLDLRWVGGPLLEQAAGSSRTPTFNDFFVREVRLTQDSEGRNVIRMDGFKFGSRIPIQTYLAVASANGTAPPTISYENTGLNTDISMREGEPVVVGTLNVGPSGEAIILVVSARRATR